jgi:hypothetical protein
VDETNLDPLKRICRVTGLAHAWFGGPGCAGSGKKNECEARVFLRHPDTRIVGLCTKKASLSQASSHYHQPPLTSRPETGQKAKEQMKMNHLAKTVVLGLAVLLASSAFATNKGTLKVREPLEVNGQQLAPGEYQLRWDGTGSVVEVSIMRGNKEVVKTSAKVVALDRAPEYDSSVIDHASGKAAVSEVRFAGKKYALALGATDKAEMSGSSSK